MSSLVIVAAAVAAAFPACSGRIQFEVNCFFVCYKSADDAHSASSVTSAVQSYGGAGYIVGLNGAYYVTVSCYYAPEDAEKVCLSLNSKGLKCEVIEAYSAGYDLPSALRGREGELLGSLDALLGAANIFYRAANSVDSGELDGEGVRSLIADARSAISGVARANRDNALGGEAEYLSALAEDCITEGVPLSRELRALQIAVLDCLLHLNFCN